MVNTSKFFDFNGSREKRYENVATDDLFFKKLRKMANLVKNSGVKIDSKKENGRRQSFEKESDIINVIDERFDIKTSKSDKSFEDFFCLDEPVDIKIIRGSSNGNSFSTKNLWYVFFDEVPRQVTNNKTANKIGMHFNRDDLAVQNDFYYIVYIKDKHECFPASFLRLNRNSITINPSNFVQVTWKKYSPVNRNTQESTEFALKCWTRFCEKRNGAHKINEKYGLI